MFIKQSQRHRSYGAHKYVSTNEWMGVWMVARQMAITPDFNRSDDKKDNCKHQTLEKSRIIRKLCKGIYDSIIG